MLDQTPHFLDEHGIWSKIIFRSKYILDQILIS